MLCSIITPCPASLLSCLSVLRVAEVDLSPHLRLLSPALQPSFAIRRNASACLTPARNPQVALLAAHFQELKQFSDSVAAQLHALYSQSRQKKYVAALFSGNGVGGWGGCRE